MSGTAVTAPVAVNVEGYLSTCAGQAEATRLYAEALRRAGADVGTTTIELGELLPGAELPLLPGGGEPDAPSAREPEVNLLGVNGLELGHFASLRGRSYFDRPTVGIWAWETDVVPEPMRIHAELLAEIWVYSEYIASNLAPHLGVPVIAVPIPVSAPPAPPGRRLELPDGFSFLFVFDFLGTLRRKNPIGVVEAFKRAFAPAEGPALVLKALNGDERPEARAELEAAIGERGDVVVIERVLDEAERGELFQRADCYVSLHRSEGFGLTAAEAMACAKPVIATGYSGNTDFMSDRNSYLIGFELTRVGHDGAPYPEEGTYAEPDLDAAAAAMRRVWEHPEEARQRGERARLDIEANLSPAAVGARARARLEEIRGA